MSPPDTDTDPDPGTGIGPTRADRRTGPVLDDARAVFLAWERLRVAYNGVLVAETLVLGLDQLADRRFWWTAGLGAFAANVCFCAGPVLEGYWILLTSPGRGSDASYPIEIARDVIRLPLFLAGLVVAVVLTMGTVLASSMRDY